ncbi:MAG: DUF2550 domain-containing protein [Nocardioidaceae bacterium]
MAWWQTILDSFGLLLLIPIAGFLYLFVRRRWLSRSGGTFECSLRMKAARGRSPGSVGRGWTLGLGRYSGESLQWFRVFSFSARPKHMFDRGLEVTARRTPRGAEAFSLYSGHLVVSVKLASGELIELAMSEAALTGFLAWTEAAPPGHDRLLF